MKKRTGIIIGIIVIALTLPPCYSIVTSPPKAGKSIAETLEIPHRAAIAHRGLSWWAPETTEPAYILARDIGADYLEIDVQRTRDGVLIGFHDETLERVSNVEDVFPDRAKDPVKTFTHNELKKLDIGTWFNEAYPEKAREAWEGLSILTLEELIDIAEGGENKPGLYIESKSADLYPGIEKEIVDLLKRRGWINAVPPGAEDSPGQVNVQKTNGRVIFQSFSYQSILEFKRIAPEVPRVYLVGGSDVEELGWTNIIDQAAHAHAGLGPSGYFAWPKYTGPAHKENILLHHYTINQKWQMRLLLFFGSDGIFTDRSRLLLDVLNRDHPSLQSLYEKHSF